MEIEDQEQEIMLEPELLSSVISVNGKTGNVVLTTSDLENDSDYQTGADVQSALTEAIGTGTLTVQKNSTTVGTFNANANSDTTINLSVPTTTSELTNDANYQTGNEVANSIAAHNQSSSAHQDIRQAITDEQNARINADNGLQGQIDAITSASDVVDIVGTYADLQAYDTQHIKDNDVIKVLQDETHNDAMSYYRWSTTTHTWTYIGSEGPYYTKSETNTLLDEKLDADEVPDGFFDGPATVNPTPATSVEIEDSIKLDTVQLNGDTVQNNYTGKNLIYFAPETRSNAGIDYTITNSTIEGTGVSTGTSSTASSTYYFASNLPAGTYTFSIPQTLSITIGINIIDTNGSFHNINISAGQTFTTVTTTYIMERYRLTISGFAIGASVDISLPNELQLEAGSTATTYEPYVGGTPSPNPDYPQNINVVTGAQTITVTDGDSQSQSFTVNLGSIELCKIGDYQDYIYKSNNNWYLHKEFGKVVFDGSESWTLQSASGTICSTYQQSTTVYSPTEAGVVASASCSHFIAYTDQAIYGTDTVGFAMSANGYFRVTLPQSIASTAPALRTWLSTNNVTLYYALETATDTQIADSSLIAQLEALLKATLYQPTTTITTTGSLPAILNITAFTDNLSGVLEIAAQPDPEQIIYEDFVGTDGVNAGTAGLVPAPTTSDTDKYLKSDGTWATVSGGGGGVTVVQTTGTSQTDVMSQNASTNIVFYDPSTKRHVVIGDNNSISSAGDGIVVIGRNAKGRGNNVAIGYSAGSNSAGLTETVSIGHSASVQSGHNYSVAIGSKAVTTRAGEVNVGLGNDTHGFNSSSYRVIGGVYDGQNAQDAVTVSQVNATIDAINAALSTNIPHIGA